LQKTPRILTGEKNLSTLSVTGGRAREVAPKRKRLTVRVAVKTLAGRGLCGVSGVEKLRKPLEKRINDFSHEGGRELALSQIASSPPKQRKLIDISRRL
jgi:hypothetical protein